MWLDNFDFRINLAMGFILLLILLSYWIEKDYLDNRRCEECDDPEDNRKRYRWY